MLPFLREHFANPGSVSHQAGRWVREQVDASLQQVATHIGADAGEIVVTSGATESNNLAILGACLHPRQKRRKVLSLQTEHKAVLDPLQRLEKSGFEVRRLPVTTKTENSLNSGLIDVEVLAAELDDSVALVSVMLANNEIGTIQPIEKISELCREYDVLFHTDAAQAVGNIPVDVVELGVDLLSFSAHKFYGPKGIGGLYVRRQSGRPVRLLPQIVGGGQQNNLRSGTLNAPGVIGMAAAMQMCCNDINSAMEKSASLRNQLWERLKSSIEGVILNGPGLDQSGSPAASLHRLPGNLNCAFEGVEGQSLMLEIPQLAVSSGSACTSAEPAPSHVLLALGLDQDRARSSLRFGIGRYTTKEEIERAATWLAEAVVRLRGLLS